MKGTINTVTAMNTGETHYAQCSVTNENPKYQISLEYSKIFLEPVPC